MKDIIIQDIQKALQNLQEGGKLGEVSFSPAISAEPPKSPEFGEYTSNIALQLASALKKPPSECAELLVGHLANEAYEAKVASPGYINFTLKDHVFEATIRQILAEGKKYGTKTAARPRKINNEFISANPTGPLHIGNGRGGYFGDTLTRLLRKLGHEVKSEYYINDAGEQIVKLGHSVLKDEEAVYGGEYIDELARELKTEGKSVEEIGRLAAQYILKNSIEKTVLDMGITFDSWTSEQALLEAGLVEEALQLLAEQGHTYEQEGALWLRTTAFSDEKDRVLRKSDGTYTYFASDAGHILGYMKQGVEVILETFGADHHGYTKRFEAVSRALGYEGEIYFTLMQLVQLEKDGAPFRMSKRAGNVVTIDELIARVGKDVARFFFLLYSPDSHMTFDLGLAEERSQKNPVFYVQYAHARMASILKKAEPFGFELLPLASFTNEKERALARELYFFPEFLERAGEDYAPHRLTQYVLRLADIFHSFYGAVPVLQEEERALSEHRLALVKATKIVLQESLSLLGVQAPESM